MLEQLAKPAYSCPASPRCSSRPTPRGSTGFDSACLAVHVPTTAIGALRTCPTGVSCTTSPWPSACMGRRLAKLRTHDTQAHMLVLLAVI